MFSFSSSESALFRGRRLIEPVEEKDFEDSVALFVFAPATVPILFFCLTVILISEAVKPWITKADEYTLKGRER